MMPPKNTTLKIATALIILILIGASIGLTLYFTKKTVKPAVTKASDGIPQKEESSTIEDPMKPKEQTALTEPEPKETTPNPTKPTPQPSSTENTKGGKPPNTNPEENAKPTTDANPEENTKPTTDANPEENTKPTTDAKPEENTKPTTDAKPEENTKPTTDENTVRTPEDNEGDETKSEDSSDYEVQLFDPAELEIAEPVSYYTIDTVPKEVSDVIEEFCAFCTESGFPIENIPKWSEFRKHCEFLSSLKLDITNFHPLDVVHATIDLECRLSELLSLKNKLIDGVTDKEIKRKIVEITDVVGNPIDCVIIKWMAHLRYLCKNRFFKSFNPLLISKHSVETNLLNIEKNPEKGKTHFLDQLAREQVYNCIDKIQPEQLHALISKMSIRQKSHCYEFLFYKQMSILQSLKTQDHKQMTNAIYLGIFKVGETVDFPIHKKKN